MVFDAMCGVGGDRQCVVWRQFPFLGSGAVDVTERIGEAWAEGVGFFATEADNLGKWIFDVPEEFDLETGGTLRIKFKQIKYLKDVPNPRVVLAYSSHFK